jgi:hypothetical protein
MREHELKVDTVMRGIRSDLCVANFAETRRGIICQECNTAVDRPLPHWQYTGSSHTKWAVSSYPEMVSLAREEHSAWNAAARAAQRRDGGVRVLGRGQSAPGAALLHLQLAGGGPRPGPRHPQSLGDRELLARGIPCRGCWT